MSNDFQEITSVIVVVLGITAICLVSCLQILVCSCKIYERFYHKEQQALPI